MSGIKSFSSNKNLTQKQYEYWNEIKNNYDPNIHRDGYKKYEFIKIACDKYELELKRKQREYKLKQLLK